MTAQSHALSHNMSDLSDSFPVYEGANAASQTPPGRLLGNSDAGGP